MARLTHDPYSYTLATWTNSPIISRSSLVAIQDILRDETPHGNNFLIPIIRDPKMERLNYLVHRENVAILQTRFD